MNNKDLGTYLARKLFEAGGMKDRPATRIQFKTGNWQTGEKDLGGFSEKPLAEFLTRTLDGLGANNGPG